MMAPRAGADDASPCVADVERRPHADPQACCWYSRRARALQQDVEWGARTLDDADRERLRQFLAGRSEIAAGDRMVLGTLRGKARERQRYWLGLPLVTVGLGAAIALARPIGRRALAAR